MTSTVSKRGIMKKNHIARASVTILAPIEKVWNALVNPEQIRKYMFGAEVTSTWKEGSVITWKGNWQGKEYEDKGIILQMKPRRLLQYSHYSPLTGARDTPENYHFITIELAEKQDGVQVNLAQDNNATEEACAHSENNWNQMLNGLKKLLEGTETAGV